MKKALYLTLAALMAVSSPVAAQTQIGASGADSDPHPWGKPNTQTYGQTITVGSDNVLTDFSFWFGEYNGSDYDLDFRAYVYDWNGARATGAALWQSGVMNISGGQGATHTQQLFNTGGVSLTAGQQYVLFASVSGLLGSGSVRWSGNNSNPYAGGNFVYQNNGEDVGSWTSQDWTQWVGTDVQFEANFVSAAVPEPGTVALLGSSLVLLLGMAYRRREDLPTTA